MLLCPLAAAPAAVAAFPGLNLNPAYLAARIREIALAMRDSARPPGVTLRVRHRIPPDAALSRPASTIFAGFRLNGKIAYERGGGIWIKNEGTSSEEPLTTSGGADPAWSPDGTRIAFSADRDGASGDIWVMNWDGTGQTRLTSSPVNETEPAWSPDGARIVFRGLGDATGQLVVMNANGSAATPASRSATP